MKCILVVDDEIGPRESLRLILGKTHRLLLAENAEQARQFLDREIVDLVLLDVRTPDKEGLAVLREIRGLYPHLPVVLLSASAPVRTVMEAMKEGASDYIAKPFDVDGIQYRLRRVIEEHALRRRVQVLESDVAMEFAAGGVVGQSTEFRKALAALHKLAGTDASVLILGERGVGKEMAARMAHALSGRGAEPFVAMREGAPGDAATESAIFGHEERGSGDADRSRAGLLDLTGAGALFLGEIGDLSPGAQERLSGVIQKGEFTRVGGSRIVRTNARILAASTRDLCEEAKAGRFRQDLLERFGEATIRWPSLRERPGDVSLLARRFLVGLRGALGAVAEDFSPEALALLEWYPWPGNVRELRIVVERLLMLHRTAPRILAEHLPRELRGRDERAPEPDGGREGSLATLVGSYERTLIEKALRDAGGVQTRAARSLGTTRRILRYRMQELNIPTRAPLPGGAG